MINEDAPTNNVAGVAGIGVGPQGEPGVPTEVQAKIRKRQKTPSNSTVMNYFRRKAPVMAEETTSRRRDKFAGVAVFEVSSSLFHSLVNEKRKGKHWRTYLEEDDCYAEIREFANKHKGPIIVQNENTGEMRYIRYKG